MSRRRVAAIAVGSLLLVALFYGPLFAWSPITPGFTRLREGNIEYETFRSFLRRYLQRPQSWRETFTRTFAVPFADAVSEFQP